MALPRVQKVVQDQNGNLVPGVLGSVYNQGTGVLAPLYNNDAGTVVLANPMTNDPTYASFKFYIAPGHYDISFTKPGYTFESIMDFQVVQDVLTLGTMSTQNANAVAITGGSIGGLSALTTTGPVGLGRAVDPSYGLSVQGAIQTAGGLNIAGDSTLTGAVGIGRAPDGAYSLATSGGIQVGTSLAVNTSFAIGSAPVAGFLHAITYNKTTQTALRILPTTSDAGGGLAVQFLNVAAAMVGSITTTGAATSFNTSSDARLKESITTLLGALAVVRALRPVSFRWQADGSQGHGFLAHELMQTIPEAVSGLPDAVNADGSVKPQQVDASRIVVWLVGALQDLAARVETFEQALA